MSSEEEEEEPIITFDRAVERLRYEYFQHVDSIAESIKYELRCRYMDDERGDSLREWLTEHIHESIDADSWIIYESKAQIVLMVSENDDEYFDQFGGGDIADKNGIKWSMLAYSAMEADVIQSLSDDGVDVNNPDEYFSEKEEEIKEDADEQVVEIAEALRLDFKRGVRGKDLKDRLDQIVADRAAQVDDGDSRWFKKILTESLKDADIDVDDPEQTFKKENDEKEKDK